MMRKLYAIFLLISSWAWAQHSDTYSVEASYLRGNILPHKDDMFHLIEGHPQGFMLSYVAQTHGAKEWHRAFNFPDYGYYFLYQDFKSQPLGEGYALGAFYNFYFLKRHLQLRILQGVALVTNPYDKVNNSKNKSFGTPVLDNTNFGITYDNQTLLKPIGFHAGMLFTHYSNGRFKSPNSGINTYMLNVGLNYNLEDKKNIVNDSTRVSNTFSEPIRYNLVFRTGINESPIIRSGQRPFYHLAFYADKRLNRKSALQLGAELFVTNSFKEYIKYYSVAYPDKHIDPNTDFKRVGVFVGHELFVNQLSLEAQLGYYVYQPFKKDVAIYDRIGVKYYMSDKWFSSFTIKTHMFLAEAIEFGIGVRL